MGKRGVLHDASERSGSGRSIKDDFEADGFLTSTGRYVDRQEAFKIANKVNQLKKGVFTEGDRATNSGSLMTPSWPVTM